MNGKRIFSPLVAKKILKSCKERLEREKMNRPPDEMEVERLTKIVEKLERRLEHHELYRDSFGQEYEVVRKRRIL